MSKRPKSLSLMLLVQFTWCCVENVSQINADKKTLLMSTNSKIRMNELAILSIYR